MSNLTVPHFSLNRYAIPKDMTKIHLEPEIADKLSKIAIDIFVDMSNYGKGFSAALLAVYLSGLEHGAEATKNV